MNTRRKNNLAVQVARLGLPPLRADDGLVELSIQEYAATVRHVVENYPGDRIPKVGDDIKPVNEDGTIPEAFVVMEVKHLLIPRAKEQSGAFCCLLRDLTKFDGGSESIVGLLGCIEL
jgi:hypothetical protein